MTDDMGARPDGTIDVLMVCPYRLEREGLRLAIQRDHEIRVVGVAGDAAQALYVAERRGPDVAVLGWGWTDPACLEMLTTLHTAHEALALLVVSSNGHATHIQEAIDAGARGFLPADVDPDDLIHGIRTVVRDGDLTLHPSLAPAFLSWLAGRAGAASPPGPFDSLTPREQEVVRLLASGLPDRDMAQALFISVRTVQTHLAHIYAKLGVHTRTEAALMAVREGWARLEPDGDPDGSR